MSNFKAVKDAFVSNAEANLLSLNVNLKHGIKGEWSAGQCVLCEDKSHSASYSQQGFLKCHQCGVKLDLFDWLAKRDGGDSWSQCQTIAKLVNVDMRKAKTKKPSTRVREMDAAASAKAFQQLLERERDLCQFLEGRKIFAPQILEKLGVGAVAGLISFTQFEADGTVRPRYRTYSTLKSPKWSWPGQGPTQGFWPPVPASAKKILLLEGEWDVLTAYCRLELQDEGIFATTWTGGAGAPIHTHFIPDHWHGKPVDICYDNDTFQGKDWKKHRAPDSSKMLPMERRRSNLINGVAKTFAQNGCNTNLLVIPIDPVKHFGADFRDWVDSGGRSIDDLERVPYLELEEDGKRDAPVECSFGESFELSGRRVTLKCQVGVIEAEAVAFPKVSALLCEMGTRKACDDCLAPTRFPEGSINWEGYQRELGRSLSMPPERAERWVLTNVVGKPLRCPKAELIPVESRMGARWTAIALGKGDGSQRELLVISEVAPTLSGEVIVTGTIYHHDQSVVLVADEIRQQEQGAETFGESAYELRKLCPWDTNDVDELHKFFNKRSADLASNVTKIYGRPEIHISHDLLMHSPRRIRVEGSSSRGWLDIAVIGDTRTGKSLTFRRLFEFHGVGSMHTCIENVSRAGLTMGIAKSATGMKMRPGLFPRAHGKALILDEFHFMVEKSKDNPMLHLQSARDEGVVYAVKVSGDRALPAEVRLACVGNWARGNRDAFRFPCEHLLNLYGSPEAVSRCDFGVTIYGNPSESSLTEVEQVWTEELVRALILRAWSLEEDAVVFAEGCIEFARETCESWRELYDFEELPLFTPEEKFFSLLRIAASVANVTFSHSETNIMVCEVREVHVRWAAEWLQSVWKQNGYEAYSRTAIARSSIKNPHFVEAMFTVDNKLKEPIEAANVLNMLLGQFSMSDLVSVIGKETQDALRWVSTMMRCNVFRQKRAANAWNTGFIATKIGATMIRNLILCAEDYPHIYKSRYDRIESWMSSGTKAPPALPPLDQQAHLLRTIWDDDVDDKTDLFQGPGSL